jgi:hypothetical protein
MKGSRTMAVSENNLQTLEKYNLFADLLDSNGIVDDGILERLQLNVRSLMQSASDDVDLITLAQDVIFHPNMKALALHQLILLYIDWLDGKNESGELGE